MGGEGGGGGRVWELHYLVVIISSREGLEAIA